MDKEAEKRICLTEFEHCVMRIVVEEKLETHKAIARRVSDLLDEDVTISRIRNMCSYSEERANRSLFYKLSRLANLEGEDEIHRLTRAALVYKELFLDEAVITPPDKEPERSVPPVDPPQVERPHESLTRPSSSLEIYLGPVLLTVIYLVVILFFFVPVWLQPCKTCPHNYYSNIYLLLPAIAGLWGVIRRLKAQLPLRDRFGIAYASFCVGLFSWAFGATLWLRYNMLGIYIPYPSDADGGYFIHGLCWMGGLFLWSKQRGISLRQQPPRYTILPFLLLCAVAIVVVFLSRQGRINLEGDPLKLLFDMGYSVVDAVNLVLLLAIVRDAPREQVSVKLYLALWVLLRGMVVLYLANLAFSAASSIAQISPNHFLAYYNGSYVDLLLATALFLLGISVLVLPLHPDEIIRRIEGHTPSTA